jgi:LEA14-like dessication related protein
MEWRKCQNQRLGRRRGRRGINEEQVDKKRTSEYLCHHTLSSPSRRLTVSSRRVASSLVLEIGGLILLLLPAGCAGLGKPLEPPRITLSNVRFEEPKALETVLQIELRVFNTNDVPIRVKGLDCDLELNGKSFAQGVSSVDKEIPALGMTTVPVTLYSSVVDLFRGIVGLQKTEKLKFGVSGRLHLEGGFLMPSVIPFKAEEELAPEGLEK